MKIFEKMNSVFAAIKVKPPKFCVSIYIYIYLIPFIIIFCLHMKTESSQISKHSSHSIQFGS